ncbi:MAG: pyruvate kinase, partial [Betaproteobacteria bacterium]|nr:pyruvate kinase [Betaproteobacteria bacterium]
IYRDVRPMLSRYEAFDRDALLRACLNQLLEAGVVEQGDLIVLTIGEPIGKAGGTNTLKLVRVGEH